MIAFLLACLLSLDGCAGILLTTAMNHPEDILPPEQIRAYNEVGYNVYGCITIGGPPPAGNALFIIVPKTGVVTPTLPRFSDGCHLLSQ